MDVDSVHAMPTCCLAMTFLVQPHPQATLFTPTSWSRTALHLSATPSGPIYLPRSSLSSTFQSWSSDYLTPGAKAQG